MIINIKLCSLQIQVSDLFLLGPQFLQLKFAVVKWGLQDLKGILSNLISVPTLFPPTYPYQVVPKPGLSEGQEVPHCAHPFLESSAQKQGLLLTGVLTRLLAGSLTFPYYYFVSLALPVSRCSPSVQLTGGDRKQGLLLTGSKQPWKSQPRFHSRCCFYLSPVIACPSADSREAFHKQATGATKSRTCELDFQRLSVTWHSHFIAICNSNERMVQIAFFNTSLEKN